MVYIFGTTLLDQDHYKNSDFSMLYHERWQIEELYNVSKMTLEIEHFHTKTQRGVRQELYVHLLLINISGFFEMSANDKLPPMSESDSKHLEEQNIYKLFNSLSLFNINFKQCMITVSRHLEDLILGSIKVIQACFSKILGLN